MLAIMVPASELTIAVLKYWPLNDDDDDTAVINKHLLLFINIRVARWHSIRLLDLQSIGRGFESQPTRCRVQPQASC